GGASGQGGTQAAGGAAGAPSNGNAQAGSLGQGGQGSTFGASAGGGGGYYGGGGGGGSVGNGGGGGGSSYAAPGLTAVTLTAGANTGNGSITISPSPAVQYVAPAISGANVVLPAASTAGAVVFTGTPGLSSKGSQLYWDNAANRLGIGTGAPAFPLQVVNGVYSSGGSAEFTFADRADNSKRFSWYATNDRATIWHSVGGDGLTINSAGNVGIGTTAPGARLDVRGAGGYSIDLAVNGRMHTGDGTNGGGVFLNGGNTQFVGQLNGSHIGFYNAGWRMVVSDAGRVGIGTATPQVPLDVQGGASIGTYYFAYYNINGPDGSGFSNSNQPDVTIRASGRVVGAEFNATSDRRLKAVIGLSNSAADLSLLTKLRITDYTMRDRAIYGGRQFKKVIAQEVEAVFPQAVHRQTGFLPDVYAVAASVQRAGDSLVCISLPAGLTTAASAGQRLRLLVPTGSVVGTVAQTAAVGARQLLVRGAVALAGRAEVFVFGLEHNDVRTVDYEALAMLNVSATQELARQLTRLEQQSAAQQTQLQQHTMRAEKAETALNAVEQRLQVLEQAEKQFVNGSI
ncbi:tail fiber domain-containing protein, partial [Hymenobacter sp. ASUV-10]